MVFVLLELSGCATTPPPKNRSNACSIFHQYPSWYRSAVKAQKRWHAPVNVTMSIMYYESGFVSDAKPPREKLLWIIPWKRPSSAYGYCQATNGTWKSYKRSTSSHFVDRDDFEDAIDFIGWYIDQAHRKLGLCKNDAYNLYLAYHDGIIGYRRGTYKNKKWLLNLAKKVERRALIYKEQLKKCCLS